MLGMLCALKAVFASEEGVDAHAAGIPPQAALLLHLESFDGLFVNHCDEIMVLCDFLGRVRVLRAINN